MAFRRFALLAVLIATDMNSLLFLALSLLVCGSVCIYLASPHQHMLAVPLRALPARVAGLLFLCGGFAVLLQVMQVLAAAFTSFAALMFFFVALPYLGALFASQRKR